MQNRFVTDALAAKLMQTLASDLGYSNLGRGLERDYYPIDPFELKKVLQVDGFLKKYIFQEDALTPEAVHEDSLNKFLANQHRITNHCTVYDKFLLTVMGYARGWIDNVLLDYDQDEHLDLCYFPRRASVGTPLQKATLCERWQRGLTGSYQHVDWFNKVYIPWLGHSAPRKRNGVLKHTPRIVDKLAATFVPKTWKSLRMIVPNTSIGGLYTNGLGRVIENRLRRCGYDISKLPDIHKSLARSSSKKRHLCTIDQSLASDNITRALVENLVPLRWFKRLDFGRIDRLELPGARIIKTNTFSMMGTGFTFPLQTLIFLGLLHGIYDTVFNRSRNAPRREISVFGDDIICPVEMKDFVIRVFADLGLQINVDKSFYTGAFKESCGGDYYHGLDVRPAFLPDGGRLTYSQKAAYLFKTFNALTKRWNLNDIPRTVSLLLQTMDKKFIVPLEFGDDAGLKLTLEEADQLGLKTPKRSIHGIFTFPYLSSRGLNKEVTYHEPYYWRHLHASAREHYHQSDTLDRVNFLTGVSRTGIETFQSELEARLHGRQKTKATVKGKTYIPIPGSIVCYVTAHGRTHNWGVREVASYI